jgi:hypothetical protein
MSKSKVFFIVHVILYYKIGHNQPPLSHMSTDTVPPTAREQMLLGQVASMSATVAALHNMVAKQNSRILELQTREQQLRTQYERLHKDWATLMRYVFCVVRLHASVCVV